MITTALRFTGDHAPWLVLLVALALALLMALLYRREIRRNPVPLGWLLVLLRSLAVFIAVLTFAGPVLRHTTIHRQLTRVVLALDASSSMRLTDDQPQASNNPQSAIPNPQSRWDRLQSLLFSGTTPLLPALVAEHDVELVALRGSSSQRLWWRRQNGQDTSGPIPAQLPSCRAPARYTAARS